MNEKYYIGFDIGTDSVGWATTDEEYNLLKAKGQDFWGVYLFDEAKTSETRRANRTARRRTARKRQRIKLLQELFAEEIAKKDFWFFERLNNSKYYVEDKSENVRYKECLFHDGEFDDKQYYKKYPTIYHLRAAFLDKQKAKEITDVRLLYLAVAHIVKNRGHFLFEGQQFSIGDETNVKNALFKINEILTGEDENAATLTLTCIEEVLEVLKDKKLTKTDKERQLKELFEIGKNKPCEAIIKAMVGAKVNVKNLFDEEEPEIDKFCFDDAGFELEKLKEAFAEENFALICEAKTVYDWAVLSQILGDKKYLSEAMCEKYDMHAKDLRLLKNYILESFDQDKEEKGKYKEVFRFNKDLKNYAAYVGKDRNKSFSHAKKEDFYAYLKKFVKDEEILSRIDDGNFLDKQRTNANGVIPYQVQLLELQQILENASENFAFLNGESDGLSVKDKIESLLTFRVPYYVGPLNTAHASKGFAWVKKFEGMEKEKITPWNFEKVVDRQASEDEFIVRMTNKCTYLVGEDVLPKQSLLYSEFAFLNELNIVQFKGRRLDKQAREVILDYAKNSKRKITPKAIGEILAKAGLIEQSEKGEENFSGINIEIKSNFNTLRFFKNVFGEDFDVDMCEEIVKWFTIMGDKTDAANRAKREYNLTDEQTKKLKDLNCSGWGNLSKTLLDSDEITTIDENGEILTIIQAMHETGCNLGELLSSKFDFISAINKFNMENVDDGKVTYTTIENLYCSPSVKRAIWRTVCLAKEIEKVQGHAPSRIFIEMARGGEEKNGKGQKGKVPASRRQRLLDLYKACHKDILEYNPEEFISELEKKEDAELLSDKLYLYYAQMGRCAYTGRALSLSDVFNTNVCDIDHIYPQSKIKDDSIINNKVLCYKTANAKKGDKYPINSEIRNSMVAVWELWKEKGFINDEKFKRLTRNTPLSQDELADFINRQLVETRQSTKEVAKILKQMYPNTDIVYSKARNVVDFKNTMNKNSEKPLIVKVRELNDLHHAKDAYLNVVVGNVYYTKFNRNAAVFFKNNNVESYNINRLFEEDIKNAWTPAYKEKVVAVVNKNICRVVRFTCEGTGELYNATIKTKGTNDKLIPLKTNCPLENIAKYGGYDSATTGYFSLVRSLDKKGKVQLSIEAIPIYIDLLGKEAIFDFLENKVGLIRPEILMEKIKINSLLKLNGAYVWLRGKTGNNLVVCNANQLILDLGATIYLKKVVSFMEKRKKNKDIKVNEWYDKISKMDNLMLYKVFVDKLKLEPYVNISTLKTQADFLEKNIDLFESLSLEEECAVLYEVLHLMQCNSVLTNIELLNGGANVGKIQRNKKLSENGKCLLITQSPTGYYRNIVDLTAFYKK